MKRCRIGVIGFGKIAADQHAPAIQGDPAFELVAVSNGAGDPPEGAQAFSTFTDMLKSDVGLDAVAICTPPGPRRAIASACLSAGLHVLREKPPAGTVAEVDLLAAQAKTAGKVAFATYHAQHNAAVKRAAERLAGKRLKTVRIVWKEDIRRWHPGQEWVFEPGGFGVFDPGINALSILTRITPEPVFVTRSALYVPRGRQAPIAADLILSTGSREAWSLTATFDWRQSGPQTWEIDVETFDGMALKLRDGGSLLEVRGEDPFQGAPDEYPDVYRRFAALLETSTSQVDASPFQLVAAAFMLGRRVEVEAFDF